MLGLIKKDLLLLKNNLIFMLGFALVALIVVPKFVADASVDFREIWFSIIAVFSVLSTFSLDSINNSDSYIATIPKGRCKLVASKYLVSLLLLLFMTIISLLIWTYESFSTYGGPIYEIISEGINPLSIWIVCAIIMFISIFYPLIFKFGLLKASIILISTGLVIGLVVYYKVDYYYLEEFLHSFIYQPKVFIPITVILFVLSYFLSRMIYSRKEF